MNILAIIAVCFFAGMGAGLGTGFAGMSAAAVITPMLVTFLKMEPYEAVGIALASDVLASAVSAYTYGKNKNLDIKNGSVMMVFVLLLTLVGLVFSSVCFIYAVMNPWNYNGINGLLGSFLGTQTLVPFIISTAAMCAGLILCFYVAFHKDNKDK